MTLELARYDRPRWEAIKVLVLDSVASPHSKRAYSTALDGFFEWYGAAPRPGFTKAVIQAHKSHLESRGLAPASINVRLAAIRKLAMEAADNGLMAPELAAGISRVRGARRQGVRLGNWLSARQAEDLINSPDASALKGRRDRALLAVLIGCGLRRSEAAALTIEHIQQRSGRWVIADLVGKHGRIRSVPMPAWAKAVIDVWTADARIDSGPVFRSLNKGGRLSGGTLADKAVATIISGYAKPLGLEVSAHDLRRTYAKLAHQGRAALEQIQLSLGHASLVTTERYLGVRQDLADAPCDHLGLNVSQQVRGLLE